ncbi:5593_t:CDS:2, partial [Ambispora leptoticha]
DREEPKANEMENVQDKIEGASPAADSVVISATPIPSTTEDREEPKANEMDNVQDKIEGASPAASPEDRIELKAKISSETDSVQEKTEGASPAASPEDRIELKVKISSETDSVQEKTECVSPAASTPDSVVITTTPIPLSAEDRKELKAKILKQVEYYFSTENLKEDYYMNKLRWKTDEEWVPIDEICKFQRMQDYKDRELIVEALRESPKLLEINKNGTSVRRSPSDPLPLPEEVLNGHLFRSVYMEVKRRLDDKKKFKGSVFIEFNDKKSAEVVVGKELNYKDEKLLILLKWDYCQMKINEKGLPSNTMRHQCEKQFYAKKRKRSTDNNAKKRKRSMENTNSRQHRKKKRALPG